MCTAFKPSPTEPWAESLPLVGCAKVFAQYSATASPAISQICATALSNIIYAKKDRVFHQSKEAKEMYFLVSGAFVYYVKVTINRRATWLQLFVP